MSYNIMKQNSNCEISLFLALRIHRGGQNQKRGVPRVRFACCIVGIAAERNGTEGGAEVA